MTHFMSHSFQSVLPQVWTAKGLAEDLQLKNEKLTRHLEERKEVVFQQKKEIQQLRDRETQLRRKVQQGESPHNPIDFLPYGKVPSLEEC